MKKLNIQVFIDVIAVLTGGPVEKSVFIYDDSPSGSSGKGTHKAVSTVYPGQLIQWNLYPLDVQTPVWLGGITFGPHKTEGTKTNVSRGVIGDRTPWLHSWSGYAPLYMWPNCGYPYTFHLQFGAAGKTINLSGAKLAFPTIYTPATSAPVGENSVL